MTKKIIFTDRSDSLLNSYLRDISKFKVLENSEINELVEKAQSGDEKAREAVINSNLRFVVTVAKQFQNRGLPLMDSISSGNEGLIKAVMKFNPERGVNFLSYAVWWIKQSIYATIYWHSKEVRLPMSQQLIVNSIADAIDKFLKEHSRIPTSVEISDIINVPVEQIDFLAQFSNKLISVDAFIGDDEDNNQVCDIIPDQNLSLEDILNKEYLSAEIRKILNKLTVREHDIICMSYGIGVSKISSKIISDMYGIGRERVRQIKEAALAKIRRKFGNKIREML
jgi:RNA polymerase primary sigma factor